MIEPAIDEADVNEAVVNIADEKELFRRLWYADRDKKIDIGVDLRRFNTPDSPTFNRKDNALPVVVSICCTSTAWLLGGWVWGLAVLGSCVIFSISTLNLWLMYRLRQRTMDLAMSGSEGWDIAWRFGGLSLRRHGQAQEFGGPEHDWRQFARQLPTAESYER